MQQKFIMTAFGEDRPGFIADVTQVLYEYGCNRDECGSYPLCHPDGIIPGEKYVVTEVLGSSPDLCERGRNLMLVELMPL